MSSIKLLIKKVSSNTELRPAREFIIQLVFSKDPKALLDAAEKLSLHEWKVVEEFWKLVLERRYLSGKLAQSRVARRY